MKNILILCMLLSMSCTKENKEVTQSNISNEPTDSIKNNNGFKEHLETVDSYTKARFFYPKDLKVSRLENNVCFSKNEINDSNFWTENMSMRICFNWCEDTLSKKACIQYLLSENCRIYKLKCTDVAQSFKGKYMNFEMYECTDTLNKKIQILYNTDDKTLVQECIIFEDYDRMHNILSTYDFKSSSSASSE